MIMWMAFAAVIGGLVAAGGWACERLCEAMGWPRRFAWLAAVTLAVVIPLSARPPAPMLEAPVNASPAVAQVVLKRCRTRLRRPPARCSTAWRLIVLGGRISRHPRWSSAQSWVS